MPNKFPGITDEHARALIAREPYEGGQSSGYLTKNGTYVLASSALLNDDGQARDLFVLLPDDSVIPLSPLANPTAIERILREGFNE